MSVTPFSQIKLFLDVFLNEASFARVTILNPKGMISQARVVISAGKVWESRGNQAKNDSVHSTNTTKLYSPSRGLLLDHLYGFYEFIIRVWILLSSLLS